MSTTPKGDPQGGRPADASASSRDGESRGGEVDVHDSRSPEINWQAIADGDSNVEPGPADETAHGMIDWESLITRSDVANGLDLRDNDMGQAVANLVAYASDLGASDLFLGSDESDLCIAVRHLGILKRVTRASKDDGRRVLNHIKALGGMDLAQRLRPQDGRWVVDLPNGRRVDLRISTVPTLHGEDMAIRILERDMRLMALENLGMHPQDLGKLQSMLSSPSGLILVTGPTGAGKTTTLYACLNYLNNGTRKINTIEDPIEYSLGGVHQSQVNWKIDLDFPELLRSLLRQSADVIMIGEVRDPITAATAVRAAKSGTIVFATLHAATATAAIEAMLALDVHPHFLATSLLGVIAQRLVRTLCPKCKEGFDISESPGTFEDVRQWLTPDQGQQIYSAPGCDECRHAGYTGRTGVFELFRLTREMRRLIANRQSASDIRHQAIQEGMLDVRRSALLKVAEGITSTEEVMRVIPSEHLMPDSVE
jgi:type II secretory ATPase GspE/PulE/Tfp pilus assembly ATPase PilB-like protein